MRSLGKVDQFPILQAIYEGIFRGNQANVGGMLISLPANAGTGQGEILMVKRFRAKKLNYVDHQGVRYVEQNPASSSDYAKRARAGAQIVWSIRLRDNQYLGYVEDGEVFMKDLTRSV